MVRTLAAFVRQGLYVGLARLCTIFVDNYYRVVSDDKAGKLVVPTSAKEPKTKKEKQLVFEMFVKSNTHKNIPGREVNASWLSDINITTDLREDGKIGRKTNVTDTGRDSGSMNILSTVQRGYTQHVLIQQDAEEIAEEEEDDINEIVGTTEPITSTNDASEIEMGNDETADPSFASDWDNDAVDLVRRENTTSDVVPLSLQNLWKKGNAKFIEQKIGARRATEANRAQTSLALQKEVFKKAEARRQETQRTEVGTETNGPPSRAIEATTAFLKKLKLSHDLE
eukprot:scaffold39667_cov805-Skeletonema_dohrnii-CCMP3373.AAC.1